MFANTGTVKIEIRVDDKGTVKVKQFGDQSEKAFKRTGRSVGDFNKKLTASYSTVLKLSAAIAAFAGIAGIKGLATSFLNASRMTENFQVRLSILLGSVKEGNRLFKEMADYAGRVPFQYQEIMGAATQLSGVMKGGVDEIKKWMPLIGDLAAASGLSIQLTTEQVIRMYSAGAGAADLFRERGITAMLGFQAGVSYSAEETRQQLIDAWNDVDSQFRGATEKMAGTWDGMISMISDKWFQFRNLIMDAGVYDELKKQLDAINKKFGQWIEQNEAIIKQKVPEYIEKITTALKKIWGIISYDPDIIKYGIVGLALWGRKGAMLLGSLAHMKNWVDNLAKALGMASAGVLEFSEIATANFKELEELVKKGERLMQGPHFRGIIVPPEEVKETTHEVKELARALEEAGNKSRDMWQDWAQTAEWVKKSKKAVTEFEVWKAEETVNEMEQIYNTFIDNVQTHFADTFYDIFQGQLDSFDDFLDSMKDMFLRMLAEMAAAAAMKKIVIPMATSMGSSLGLGGLFGGTNEAAKTGGLLGSIGGFSGLLGLIGAAGIGWTIGQTLGKMLGLGKEKDPRYRFDPGWRTTAQYTPGQGFKAISNITHHGKGQEITDVVRELYEQMVSQANALLKSVPMKLQEQLEPYLQSIVFRPTDYNFKFKNAEQVIRAMAQKWTAQVEEAFNAAARAAGNASFAEMLAWEDVSWQAKVMSGAVSDLEVQIHNINEQFDAWIQQLTQLGSTEERLAEIEKYRQMALDDLTTSTANYARQIEGLQATLLNLTTGSDSPLDAMERLSLARKAIGAAMGPDMTPEDANKMQNLWMNYLRIAQEAYQRPSLEYQNIYAETTAALNSLVGWLQGMESYQHGTDYVPVTGPAILHRGERVSRPGEGASVIVNFQPTIQVDGSRDSMRASREITGEFERFMRGRGRKIVQEAVKYQ